MKCNKPNLSRQSHLPSIFYIVCVCFRIYSAFESKIRVNFQYNLSASVKENLLNHLNIVAFVF